jgi:hypothetical protein
LRGGLVTRAQELGGIEPSCDPGAGREREIHMLKKWIKRWPVFATAGAVVALALGVGAWAYFAGQGSASASFTTGGAPALNVSVYDLVNGGNDLYPGDTGDVPIRVTNASGHASGVGTIKADTPLVTDLPVGCDASWFSFANVAGGGALANGASRDYTGHLAFEDTGLDQSQCESATPTLHLKATP